MQAQTAAKVELARTLWSYGHDGSNGEEMLNERRRIEGMKDALKDWIFVCSMGENVVKGSAEM